MPFPTRPSPPWLPETLLWLCTRRADWRDTVIGDLREEYAVRRRRSRVAAAVWYWAEALSLMRLGVSRLGTRNQSAIERKRTRMTLDLSRDLRLAIRLVGRQPAFSAAVVVTLALGIGASAVIFNLLDALVVRVLQLPDAERLVMLAESTPSASIEDRAAAPANFLDWRASATAFDYMGAYHRRDANLAAGPGAAPAERVSVTAVSAGLLEHLGVRPRLGRFVSSDDEPWGGEPVAVLGEGLWRRQFGGGAGAIGQTVLLDDVPHTIVGVVDGAFAFPYGSAVWTALSLSPAAAQERQREYLRVVGRLRDDTTLDAARAELAAISVRLQQAYPASNASVTATAVPLRAAIRDEGGPAMIAAWQAAAALVLLIGCVNVAQLLLARGRARQREFTVRAALGAGLGRVVRQLLLEGLVLSALAGLLALGVSWIALSLLRASMPDELTRFVTGWEMVGLDSRLVIFTFTVSAVAAVCFSVLPALQAARVDLNDTLKQGGRGAASGGTGWRHGTLVVAEIAGALVLTVATALSVSGASNLLFGPPGFEHRSVLNAAVALPDTTYATADARRQFFDRAQDRLAALPGADAVGLVNAVPSGLYNTSRPVIVEGDAPRDTSDLPAADYRVVSPSYFDTLRIPVVQGRALLDTDGPDRPPVAVVSGSFARKFWPGRDPVGRRFRLTSDGDWILVVGVAGDIVHHWFNRRHHPTMYLPYAQDPRPIMSLVVRAAGDLISLAAPLRAAIADVDPHLPLYNVHSLERLRRVNLTGLTYLVSIMSVLGALAVLLACLGIYAVMAYGVAQQRREIGVRMALGAGRRDILRLMLGRVGRLTALGVAVGLAGAFGAGRLLAATMFGLVSVDASIFAGVALGMAIVAVAAGLLPLRDALAIDPAATLRAD